MKLSDNGCMPKILIVDDEPRIIRALRMALSSQGYLLHAAANGGEGMAILLNWRPDLVLTDVSMPKMNGIDFCRQLRKVSEVPLIVLSACTHDQAKIEALDAGADDYVTKPFSMQELHARIRAKLRRYPANVPEARNTVVVGDFRIDVLQHRVTVRDEYIRLTPLQFDLLRCFAEHAGQVLTHRAILQDVWRTDDDRSEQIRVHIGQLRKKMKFSDDPQYIVTEPWIGYRFCATGKDL